MIAFADAGYQGPHAALAAAQWGGRWVVAGPDVDAADLAPTLAP